jgi:hypothetical protein
MTRTTRLLALTLPLSFIPLGCSDDGSRDEAHEGETGDGDPGDGDPGDGDPGDGDPGDGDPGDGDPGDGDPGDGDPGDGDPGDGDPGDGDGDPQGLSVELLLNSNVIREANNEGALTAACMLFEAGLPAAEQPSFDYALTPAAGVNDHGDHWSFDEFGTWTIGCSAIVDGEELTVEREVAVLNDAIDGRVAAIGAALGTSQTALAAVLAADGGPDELLVDAITQLATVGPALGEAELDLAGLADVLVALPGGYPSSATLTSAGIVANADDGELGDALASVNAALDALAATYASFDPALAPTHVELEALEAAGASLDAALAAATLEPTAHGFLSHRAALAETLRDHLAPTLVAIDAYVVARAQVEADSLFGLAPPQPGLSPKFGLLGLTLGMFNQSYLRVKLVNQWYGDVIKELDKSINNLILSAMIDYLLPANADGPLIELLQASASVGYAVPGYDTWAYGSGFNSDPAFNLFLILGDQWQGVVSQIFNACGVSESNSLPDNVEKFNNCVKQVEDAVDSSVNYSLTVIEPGLLGGQDIHLGPFPPACSGFLPVATLVIPINLAVGRGETWLTNCLP